jgi:hypothetical protein
MQSSLRDDILVRFNFFNRIIKSVNYLNTIVQFVQTVE